MDKRMDIQLGGIQSRPKNKCGCAEQKQSDSQKELGETLIQVATEDVTIISPTNKKSKVVEFAKSVNKVYDKTETCVNSMNRMVRSGADFINRRIDGATVILQRASTMLNSATVGAKFIKDSINNKFSKKVDLEDIDPEFVTVTLPVNQVVNIEEVTSSSKDEFGQDIAEQKQFVNTGNVNENDVKAKLKFYEDAGMTAEQALAKVESEILAQQKLETEIKHREFNTKTETINKKTFAYQLHRFLGGLQGSIVERTLIDFCNIFARLPVVIQSGNSANEELLRSTEAKMHINYSGKVEIESDLNASILFNQSILINEMKDLLIANKKQAISACELQLENNLYASKLIKGYTLISQLDESDDGNNNLLDKIETVNTELQHLQTTMTQDLLDQIEQIGTKGADLKTIKAQFQRNIKQLKKDLKKLESELATLQELDIDSDVVPADSVKLVSANASTPKHRDIEFDSSDPIIDSFYNTFADIDDNDYINELKERNEKLLGIKEAFDKGLNDKDLQTYQIELDEMNVQKSCPEVEAEIEEIDSSSTKSADVWIDLYELAQVKNSQKSGAKILENFESLRSQQKQRNAFDQWKHTVAETKSSQESSIDLVSRPTSQEGNEDHPMDISDLPAHVLVDLFNGYSNPLRVAPAIELPKDESTLELTTINGRLIDMNQEREPMDTNIDNPVLIAVATMLMNGMIWMERQLPEQQALNNGASET